MSKLIRSFGNSILDLITSSKKPTNTGLVRMFETEYRKEYNCARRAGAEINDDFVKMFLDGRGAR